jgi:hypothetical protein
MIRCLTFVAIAIGLFFFPSVEYSVSFVDGPDTEFYGFPLPWNSRNIAFSVTKNVYILPLVIDVAVFLVVAYFLSRWLLRRLTHFRPVARWSILCGIWVYGGMAAAIFALVLARNAIPIAWYQGGIRELVRISLHGSL